MKKSCCYIAECHVILIANESHYQKGGVIVAIKRYFNSALMRGMRRRKKLTLKQLGEELGVHEQQIHRWETGKAAPTKTNIENLGRYFGLDWSLFLSRTDAIAWDNATCYIADKAMMEEIDLDALKDAQVLGALPSNFPEDLEQTTAEAQGADWLDESENTTE